MTQAQLDKHQKHIDRKLMKLLKRHLLMNKRERELGIPDLRWVDGRKLPK